LMSFFSSLRISMPNCARTASWRCDGFL
jgi:hypothetical protein